MEWADASFDIQNVHETKKTNITQPELKKLKIRIISTFFEVILFRKVYQCSVFIDEIIFMSTIITR